MGWGALRWRRLVLAGGVAAATGMMVGCQVQIAPHNAAPVVTQAPYRTIKQVEQKLGCQSTGRGMEDNNPTMADEMHSRGLIESDGCGLGSAYYVVVLAVDVGAAKSAASNLDKNAFSDSSLVAWAVDDSPIILLTGSSDQLDTAIALLDG